MRLVEQIVDLDLVAALEVLEAYVADDRACPFQHDGPHAVAAALPFVAPALEKTYAMLARSPSSNARRTRRSVSIRGAEACR